MKSPSSRRQARVGLLRGEQGVGAFGVPLARAEALEAEQRAGAAGGDEPVEVREARGFPGIAETEKFAAIQSMPRRIAAVEPASGPSSSASAATEASPEAVVLP